MIIWHCAGGSAVLGLLLTAAAEAGRVLRIAVDLRAHQKRVVICRALRRGLTRDRQHCADQRNGAEDERPKSAAKAQHPITPSRPARRRGGLCARRFHLKLKGFDQLSTGRKQAAPQTRGAAVTIDG
jgi:hypothetical protein